MKTLPCLDLRSPYLGNILEHIPRIGELDFVWIIKVTSCTLVYHNRVVQLLNNVPSFPFKVGT